MALCQTAVEQTCSACAADDLVSDASTSTNALVVIHDLRDPIGTDGLDRSRDPGDIAGIVKSISQAAAVGIEPGSCTAVSCIK